MSEEKAQYGKQDSPFAKHLLEMLRQRRGLEADDPSEDDWLRKYSSRHALDEVCAFVLGHSEWVDQFLGWMEAVGYQIKDKEQVIDHRRLDENLTWEIGRNEHAKRLLQRLIAEITTLHTDKILDRLQAILSCLEKPRV